MIYHRVTPVDLAAGASGAWTDWDLSSHIPANAIGVEILIRSTNGSVQTLGVRQNGSSDGNSSYGANVYAHVFTGVDVNRIIEYYTSTTTGIGFTLLGYFTAEGATFFLNSVDKSTATTGSFQDVDIASDTGTDTAIAAFLIVKANGANIGLRKNGSSDNRVKHAAYSGAIVGCDGSEIFEQQISSTSVDIFLIGYVTRNATLNTNAIDRSLDTIDDYADLAAFASGGAAGIYEMIADADTRSWAMRKNGSSDDYYGQTYQHQWAVVEGDASRIVEMKISTTGVDVFELGTFNLEPITVSPAKGDLTLTGQTPAVQTPVVASPANGALDLTGQVPVINLTDDKVVSPANGELSLIGQAPMVSTTSNVEVDPGAGALALEGQAPAAIADNRVFPGVGSLDFTGQAPVIHHHAISAPGAGSLTLTGSVPGIGIDPAGSIPIPPGNLVFTGGVPTIDAGIVGSNRIYRITPEADGVTYFIFNPWRCFPRQ